MLEILADRPAQPGRGALTVLGLLSMVGYGYVALAMPTSNQPRHVAVFLSVFVALFLLYFLALAWMRSRTGPRMPAIVFGFAILFRLVLVTAGLPGEGTLSAFKADLAGDRVAYEPFLLYDNDIWRYLWGGHVAAEGLNPYLVSPETVPDDPALEERLLATENWRDVRDFVGFKSYKTIYPPLTHYFFAALARIAPASVAAAKLALVGLDLVLCLLLWHLLGVCGLRRELVLVYAWNPAVIKEFAGSGHPDVLMMLPLLAVPYLLWRGSRAAGGGALALSAMAKVASVAALPLTALWSWRESQARHRRWWAHIAAPVAFLLVLWAGFWPLAEGLLEWLQSLAVFANRWTYNSGPWQVVHWVAAMAGSAEPARVAHLVCRGLTVALVLVIARLFSRRNPGGSRASRLRELYRGLFLTLAAVILLSPAVMPWYVLWALPAAVLAGNRCWPVFTGLALLSYLNYADGVDRLWWKTIEYGVFALAVLWDSGRKQGPRG